MNKLGWWDVGRRLQPVATQFASTLYSKNDKRDSAITAANEVIESASNKMLATLTLIFTQLRYNMSSDNCTPKKIRLALVALLEVILYKTSGQDSLKPHASVLKNQDFLRKFITPLMRQRELDKLNSEQEPRQMRKSFGSSSVSGL